MAGSSFGWLALLVLALGGAGVGAALGWLLGIARSRGHAAAADELRRRLAAAEERARLLEGERLSVERSAAVAQTQVTELKGRLEEQRGLLMTAEARLGDTFRALAADALAANTRGFMAIASERLRAERTQTDAALEARQRAIEGLVGPVRESLDKVDSKIQALEKERGQAYGQLMEQVRGLASAHERLQVETGSLARALRSPAVRGRWGEMQLRRVVELAGMVEHCDFAQQMTLVGQDNERRLRPDLVVRLPGGRHVVVDAKVPLEGYLQAMEAASETDRRARLKEHGAQVRAHLLKLSGKAYWSELPMTPEFVVMFLPGESIFGAAVEDSPTLMEEGVGRRVLLATPTTLIALLQTVHFGWRQERLAENAEKVSEQGRILHERVATLLEHWARLGTSLARATEHFNAAAASLEGRVIPAARRLEELGANGKKELPELPHLDLRPRLRAAGD
jgi:DNA recombination protein RmuC